MELSPGAQIGPYKIENKLGAGGMGVVYGAVDSRLGRKVALKLLASTVEGDADRLRRFEQEARTTGGLNHPNLVTLFDVGHHEGARYLVTELLEGRPLRAVLASGAMPPREAARIAAEVARGLAAAHTAGVVHRDIKPDNLFVTREGRVKILDFGIAKLRAEAATAVDVGNASTVDDTAGTGSGVVIGTPGYMAPEQVAGGTVDARTDLFALGVVLYEMLTGKRPFVASTGIEESYALLKLPAPELPADTPVAYARIVERCLEKRPEARFQSAADLAFALDAVEQTRNSVQTMPQPAAKPSEPATPRRVLAWRPIAIAVLALGCGFAVAWSLWGRKSGERTPAGKTQSWPSEIEGGPSYRRVTYHQEQVWFARFGNDANSVVYSTKDRGEWRVVSSDLSRPSVLPLGITGQLLDVASDRTLALRQGNALVTAIAGAGAPRELAKDVVDASFGATSEMLAIARHDGAGATIEYPIGHPIAHHDHVEFAALRVSRDGTKIAVVEQTAPPDTRGHVIVIDSHGAVLGQTSDYDSIDGLAWSPDDREIWFSAVYELRGYAPGGRDRVLLRTPHLIWLRDVARDGRILVAPTDWHVHAYGGQARSPDQDVGWLDASYVRTISDDGSAFGLVQGFARADADGYPLFVRRNDQLPFAIGRGWEIALVPDGSAAVLLVATGDPLRLVPVGAGTAKAIRTDPVRSFDLTATLQVSGDGKHVYARGAEPGKPMRIWAFDLANAAPPRPIGSEAVAAGGGKGFFRFAVTPDEAWIALAGDHGVRLVPTGAGAERELDLGHAAMPLRFTGDGKALFTWPLRGWPRAIERVELAAAAKPVAIATFDPPTKPDAARAEVSADGSIVSFTYSDHGSDLYVIEPPH